MHMIETELAWVAGLLEGEGYFGRKRPGGTARNVVIGCHMTDLDVLQKLQRLAGGRLTGPYKNGKVGNKARYMWRLAGQPAASLMEDLLPHMCGRRASRIKQLLSDFTAVVVPLYKVLHLESGAVVETPNLAAWAREQGLSESNLYRTLKGQRSQHRGWRRIA